MVKNIEKKNIYYIKKKMKKKKIANNLKSKKQNCEMKTY